MKSNERRIEVVEGLIPSRVINRIAEEGVANQGMTNTFCEEEEEVYMKL